MGRIEDIPESTADCLDPDIFGRCFDEQINVGGRCQLMRTMFPPLRDASVRVLLFETGKLMSHCHC
jgi:hypothetical protein